MANAEARPKRDRRLYTINRLFGTPGDPDKPGLLDEWHHFMETQQAPMPSSGYGASFGHSSTPEVAAFEARAAVYADIDNALPKDRRGQAVRLYFQGLLDTNPKSKKYGRFVKPNYEQLRFAMKCAKNILPDLIYWGLVELVWRLCWGPVDSPLTPEDAAYIERRVERWWGARNHGWRKTRLP